MESTPTKSIKSPNPSDYGFVYSADRPVPPPEAGWSERDDHKINLYSENILKEGDTSDSVDRESIADLLTTKKQWEVILTSQSPVQGEGTLRKKSAPKWEVRVPYTEKQSSGISADSSQTESAADSTKAPDMFKKAVDTESAIEREIRLAHEREEVLRREQEMRLAGAMKVRGQSQIMVTSLEAESESFHQPGYNELTEADRGRQLWGREQTSQDYLDRQQTDQKEDAGESIIEREIRLQRERELELAKLRKESTTQQTKLATPEHQGPAVEPSVTVPAHQNHVHHEKQVAQQSSTISYEEAIAKNSHDGENLIARELRELKEREEEFKRLHSSLQDTHISQHVEERSSTPHIPKSASAPSPRLSNSEPGQSIWQRDLSFPASPRRDSVDSDSSHGSARASENVPLRRDVRVKPLSDGHSIDDDKKPNYFEKQETPIEREMRLARERENELRRMKGLPEIDHKDENPYSSYGGSQEKQSATSPARPPSVGQPSDSMKKFATNRLQQELLQQKEREHELRSQGKIISTSEEHIEPKRYMEVAGVDAVDGTEKRNYTTKRISVYGDFDTPSAQGPTTPSAVSTSGGQGARKSSSAASGGNMFSYKEFKQTAESKIERELREMREREEELRVQRKQPSETSP